MQLVKKSKYMLHIISLIINYIPQLHPTVLLSALANMYEYSNKIGEMDSHRL